MTKTEGAMWVSLGTLIGVVVGLCVMIEDRKGAAEVRRASGGLEIRTGELMDKIQRSQEAWAASVLSASIAGEREAAALNERTKFSAPDGVSGVVSWCGTDYPIGGTAAGEIKLGDGVGWSTIAPISTTLWEFEFGGARACRVPGGAVVCTRCGRTLERQGDYSGEVAFFFPMDHEVFRGCVECLRETLGRAAGERWRAAERSGGGR